MLKWFYGTNISADGHFWRVINAWGNIYFQPPILVTFQTLSPFPIKTVIAGQRQWNKKLTKARVLLSRVNTVHHSFSWKAYLYLFHFLFLFLISVDLFEHFCETRVFGTCNSKNVSTSCLWTIYCWKWTCGMATLLSVLLKIAFLIQGSVSGKQRRWQIVLTL